MIQLKSVAEVRTWGQDKQIGFVPTMGALHAGHLSLLAQAKAENKVGLVSIFVNPTQFNDKKDLEHYPRPLNEDLELLQQNGSDAVFLPRAEELYADQYRYKIQEAEFSQHLCGAHRPGHFDGVLTVMMKLLQIVQPKRAYFGEKDFQQLQLIRDMATAFFLPIEIVGVQTLREADGLAQSSRNRLLAAPEREKAPLVYRALRLPVGEGRALLEQNGFKVDYLEERAGRRLVAAHLGAVRLIDNVEV